MTIDSALAVPESLLIGGEHLDASGGARFDVFNPSTGDPVASVVLDRVPLEADILHHEIFGPVAPVVRFEDTAEAVRMANDTEYGLVSYVYISDLAVGLCMSEQLESGIAGLNRPVVSDPAARFGGVKESGLGRQGGHGACSSTPRPSTWRPSGNRDRVTENSQ